MIEINLIPDVKQELIKAQRTRSAVIAGAVFIGIGSVVVVVLLAMYVFGAQAFRNSLADSDIASGIEKLKKISDLPKTLTIQNQLTKISALNADKKIDSRIFDVLSAVIPPSPNNIQVSAVTVDSELKTFTIEGQAANSYSAAEIFKKTVEGAKLKYTDKNNSAKEVYLASEISLGNTSYGADATGAKVLRFTLSFIYASELFDPASKSTSIAVTVDGNVTDSYLGIPKAIFADRATDITTEEE